MSDHKCRLKVEGSVVSNGVDYVVFFCQGCESRTQLTRTLIRRMVSPIPEQIKWRQFARAWWRGSRQSDFALVSR